MDRQHGGCLRTTGGSEELAVGRKSPPLSLKASRYLSLQLFTSSEGGVLVWGDAQLLVIPGASYRGEGSVQILGCLLLQEALTACSTLRHCRAAL